MYFHVKSAHTHTLLFFCGCNVFWLKKGRLKKLGRYGMNMNHMIALKSLESSFRRQIFYLYFKYFSCINQSQFTWRPYKIGQVVGPLHPSISIPLL